jgi:hypothetical protein
MNNSPEMVEGSPFKYGDIYLEAKFDADGENHIEPDENYLLLLTNENLALYVDEPDFMLIKEKVHPLLLELTFCEN